MCCKGGGWALNTYYPLTVCSIHLRYVVSAHHPERQESGQIIFLVDSEQNLMAKFEIWCALIGVPTVSQLAI